MTSPADPTPGLRRRALLGAAAAGTAALAALDPLTARPAQAAGDSRLEHPAGPGSVSGAPRLPPGFRRTFTSRFVHAGGLRQHAVIGGDGPPLLLVHGWPENWYAWRLVMPALARDFTVIAVDQRGIGLTDKPESGYDTGTLATDLAALMDALGHRRFAVVGHDTGMPIAYALAADYRDRVDRVAVAEALPFGIGRSPALLVAESLNNRLWHIPFNRVDDELTVELVRGREDIFFGYEFRIQGGPKLPDYAVRYYVSLLARSRRALRGSFEWYRALDTTIAQNVQRQTRPLPMPVLGIGGADGLGTQVADAMKLAATDVRTLVIPGAGHWVAEQAPQQLLARLATFLARA